MALPEASLLLRMLLPTIEPMLNVNLCLSILSVLNRLVAPIYARISSAPIFAAASSSNSTSTTIANAPKISQSTSFSPSEEATMEDLVIPLMRTLFFCTWKKQLFPHTIFFLSKKKNRMLALWALQRHCHFYTPHSRLACLFWAQKVLFSCFFLSFFLYASLYRHPLQQHVHRVHA